LAPEPGSIGTVLARGFQVARADTRDQHAAILSLPSEIILQNKGRKIIAAFAKEHISTDDLSRS